MLTAYAESHDLHALTAQHLARREEDSKGDRKLAKTINFGLLYRRDAKGAMSSPSGATD
jgi:DNA polymerase I-like protein with 3'-5' exonuclease and polymerase domains